MTFMPFALSEGILNPKKFAVAVTEIVTWSLFFIATLLLARQTWYAVQGLMPDYSGVESAIIVAGIVTLTWLVMLARLALGVDQSPVDWFISFSLLIAGIAVDIAVALSVVFEWVFPVHIALLVVVGHVLAHVVQWVVAAAQSASVRFGAAYESAEKKAARLEREEASSKVARSMLEQANSKLEAQVQQIESKHTAEIEQLQRKHALELAGMQSKLDAIERGFDWTCPDCQGYFKHPTEELLERAKRTHTNQRCPKRAGLNGHHQKQHA
jgi:hypothetical protein